jgi:hypothetical protein
VNFDDRLRDAMHAHADELDQPLASAQLAGRLDHAIHRRRVQRTGLGALAAVVVVVAMLTVSTGSGRQDDVQTTGDNAELANQPADERTAGTNADGSPVDPASTTTPATDPVTGQPVATNPDGTAATPGATLPGGAPVTTVPSGSSSTPTTSGGVPSPTFTVPHPTIVPPSTDPPPLPCTVSFITPSLKLSDLTARFSGTGQKGTTVDGSGAWSMDVFLLGAVQGTLHTTVTCSTGESFEKSITISLL